MARICYNCEKKTVHGRSQQHRRGVAGKRWKKRTTSTPRVFMPNLQAVTIMENGRAKKVMLCTKCIKRRKKDAYDQALSV